MTIDRPAHGNVQDGCRHGWFAYRVPWARGRRGRDFFDSYGLLPFSGDGIALFHGHRSILEKHLRPAPPAPGEKIQEMILAYGLSPSWSVDSIGAASNHTCLISHIKSSLTRHSRALHPHVYKVCRRATLECNAGLRLLRLDGMPAIRLFRLPCPFLFESACHRS